MIIECYQENWWLAQLIRNDHGAICRPTPGTGWRRSPPTWISTSPRASALSQRGQRGLPHVPEWQHVGGGIVAISTQRITPGCLWLDPSTNTTALLQRRWLYLNHVITASTPTSYVGR